MGFKEKLKQVMEGQNISQADLSRMTGINRSSLSMYIAGYQEPENKRKRKIEEALNLPNGFFDTFGEAVLKINDAPCKNLPVELVANLMGKSILFVQKGLQDGVFPWGYGVKMEKWSYWISPVKFEEHTGLKVPYNQIGGELQ